MQSMSKGQSLSYATSPWHFLERPVSLAEAKVVITPMGDMARFAGILELTRFDDSIGMRRIRGVQKAITYKKSAPLLLEGLKDGRKMFWDIYTTRLDHCLCCCWPDGQGFATGVAEKLDGCGLLFLRVAQELPQ